MAVSKAQLVVWALIAGLGAWGYSALSRVTLPVDLFADAPVARIAAAQGPAAVAVPRAAVASVSALVDELPATIPEFPFPDLPAATLEAATAAFPQIPDAAIPDITAMAEPEAFEVEAGGSGAEPMLSAEAPPIPAPARPSGRPRAVQAVDDGTLYVIADTLNVRAAPSTEGAVLQKVALGFAFSPQERSEDWVGFRMKDGSTGWLRTDFLSSAKPEPAPLGEAAPMTVAAESSGDTGPLNLMM